MAEDALKMSSFKNIVIYTLVDKEGHRLTYNPAEGLIFFESAADPVSLSRALSIPTSHRPVPRSPATFTLEEMRSHYSERLKQGFVPQGKGKALVVGDPKIRRNAKYPEDFEYGLTDT